MDPVPEIDLPPLSESSGVGSQDREPTRPMGWSEAFASLVSSRLALVQLESKEVIQSLVRRLVHVAIILICAFFTWALLLAGGIILISKWIGCSWAWVALIIALLHFVISLFLLRAVKAPAKQAFPATRAEFQKDREWLDNLQKKQQKSNV